MHLRLATLANHLGNVIGFDVLLLILFVNPVDFFLCLPLFFIWGLVIFFIFINNVLITWCLNIKNWDWDLRTYVRLFLLRFLLWTLCFGYRLFWLGLLKQLNVLHFFTRLAILLVLFPPIFSLVTLVAQVVHSLHKMTKCLLLLWQLLLNPLESFRQLVILLVFLFVLCLFTWVKHHEFLLK